MDSAKSSTTANSPKNSMGEGVFYSTNDYAGFIARLIAMGIDFVLIACIGFLLWETLMLTAWNLFQHDPIVEFLIGFLTITWLYMTTIKASKVRTLGYRIARLKIVNLNGQRPSIFRMTFRLLLWMPGPFNFFLDLIWQGADSERQGLRDCYAGTYVIRAGAKQIGHGPLHLARYHGFGFTLTYPRVRLSGTRATKR